MKTKKVKHTPRAANMDYQEIARAELMANDIKLCRGCDNGYSHNRGWSFTDTRTICLSALFATRTTLYKLLHEVGHIVSGHGRTCKLRRYEKEAQAEEYARLSFLMLGIPCPRSRVAAGNAYISRRKRTGDRIIARRKMIR